MFYISIKVLNLRFRRGYMETVVHTQVTFLGISVSVLSGPPRVEALRGVEVRETVFNLS